MVKIKQAWEDLSKVGKNKIILGIDPGQSGGITEIIYKTNSLNNLEVNCYPMPETESSIFNLIEGMTATTSMFAYIENVHSFPGQGVASSFKFGMGYGGLRMALIALGIPFETVSPQRWQKELCIPKRKPEEKQRQFKTRLLAKAQQLFPKLEVWDLKKEIQLSVCDSLLIAEWGRRIRNHL